MAVRVPVAWGGLRTTWGLLTPSPHLPSQHPHKIIVCLQIKILADVWHTDVLEDASVVRAPSFRPGLLLRCDAVHWIPDTTKKQRIPFDVSHNFVLLTIMKYKTTGERGGQTRYWVLDAIS